MLIIPISNIWADENSQDSCHLTDTVHTYRLQEATLRIRLALSPQSCKELLSVTTEFFKHFAELVQTSKKIESNEKTMQYLGRATQALQEDYKEKVIETISNMRRDERVIIQKEIEGLTEILESLKEKITTDIEIIKDSYTHSYLKSLLAGCIDVGLVVIAVYLVQEFKNKDIVEEYGTKAIFAVWVLCKTLSGQSIGDLPVNLIPSRFSFDAQDPTCMVKALILLIAPEDINLN